jgi:hypothetical protein
MQVKQLCCDGSISQVCSLGGGSQTFLVAALADRLLLMRRSNTGVNSVSSRYVSVLEPLLRGWASLAAMGILPGTIIEDSAQTHLPVSNGAKLVTSTWNLVVIVYDMSYVELLRQVVYGVRALRWVSWRGYMITAESAPPCLASSWQLDVPILRLRLRGVKARTS